MGKGGRKVKTLHGRGLDADPQGEAGLGCRYEETWEEVLETYVLDVFRRVGLGCISLCCNGDFLGTATPRNEAMRNNSRRR